VSEIVLRRSDLGRPIHIRQGDSIVLELEENPSTGYSWELADLPAFVTVAESSHETAGPPAMGAPGLRRIRVLAVATGEGVIVGHLQRPWDRANVAESFSIPLSVR
jgi:inhibitor of cysteine peptidase